MKQTILVDGMTCSKCEAAVKDALNSVDGVENVNVDLETGEVDVDHNDVDPLVLETAIEEQGYDVRKQTNSNES